MAYMSQEGYDKLIAELQRLEGVERPKPQPPSPRPVKRVTSAKTLSMMPPRRLRPIWKTRLTV